MKSTFRSKFIAALAVVVCVTALWATGLLSPTAQVALLVVGLLITALMSGNAAAFTRRHAVPLALAFAVFVALQAGFVSETMTGFAPIMAMATTAFPVNSELTAIAIGFQNPDAALIADRVLPRVPTPKKFSYTVYSAALGYTVPETKVGRKSEPNMVDFGGSLVAGEVVDYGLDDLVPNDEVAAWESMPKPATGGPVNPLALSTMMLTGLVQLDREIRVAGTVFNAANYAAANQATLAGTSQWSDYANSNPLQAITNALDTPLVRPNKMVIGRLAWTVLRGHPKIVQAIGRSAQTAGNASLQQVADLLELQEILVGAAFYNTAKKGQPPVYARAWGKHASLLHIDSLAAQLQQPTYGWTAQWGTRIAGDLPEPKSGLRGGVRVRSGESVQEVIVSTDAGYFFQNAVA